MLIRKQTYPKQLLITILAGIIITGLSLPLTSRADDKEIQEIKEEQLKLKKLLDQIGSLQEERKQQRATLEKINHQMECNWTLIKDYDACEGQNKGNLQEQIDCKVKAKEKAKNCLSADREN